jgi:Domain of unknown function (DUF5655)/Domain of unknown function (DUF4287)
MSTLDQARQTQLRNIEAKTGQPLAALREVISASGLLKHGELRSMLMARFSLGHGDANALVHFALASDGQSAAEAAGASDDALLDEIYSGKKAPLRPIHDALMRVIAGFGAFELAPKKGYVSLRRKKQFAMIGPATAVRVELGLNLKGVPGTTRLLEQAAGGMCSHKLRLTAASEVDAELCAWLRQAFDAAC